MILWVQSTRRADRLFRVLSFDPSTNTGVLLGSVGVPFRHSLDKDYLIQHGYKLVKEEGEPPPMPAVTCEEED